MGLLQVAVWACFRLLCGHASGCCVGMLQVAVWACFRLLCGHASQKDNCLKEKEHPYDKLRNSGICIAHISKLCARVTLIDM